MDSPSPPLVALARRIVEHEAGGSQDPAGLAAAVEAAWVRLKDHFVDLLGSGGVAALLRRALHLAQREQPLLANVTVSSTSAGSFAGLAESLTASTDEEATAAAAALLTHLLHLLIILLGEELSMKSIRKLWPGATSATEMDP